MSNLIKLLKPYVLQIVLVIGLVYIQVMTDLALPEYMSKIVNEGIVAKNMDFIISTGGQMLLVTAVGAVATIAASYFSSKIATGYARDLRHTVFSKVQSYSMKEFDKFSTSSLITRSTNDIQQIQTVIFMILRMVVSAPIMGIGAVIKANATAPSLSWIILLAVITLVVLIVTIFIFAMPKFQLLQKLTDKLNLVTRESLTGLRVIRAFTKEKYEEKKFSDVNNDLVKVNLFVNRLFVIMQPLMMLIFNITSLGIIWFGAKLIDTNSLGIGDMMAFMQYAIQVIMSFLMFSMVFIVISRATISAKRVSEVLGTESEIKDAEDAVAVGTNFKSVPTKQIPAIEFRDVTFSYADSDEPVLKDINFTIDRGNTVAIIGSTGCGKSTLINLIPRFYDVTKGEILIDGTNIKGMKQKDLHDKIGLVPQKGNLFSGTIASNISYGLNDKETSNDVIKQAAQIAQASEFIEKLEDGYDSPISQGGTNVSGGQKQRISIARALAKRPEIYIFDDSFSALDFKTDAKLRAALQKETNGATVIIVTQRVGSVMYADQIIVLDEGKIVGKGKHRELLTTCEVYREIAESQLSEEELKK